jgi:hypothetical protein
VVNIAVAGYIVDHCCSMLDRGVVHIVVAVILFPITNSGLTGMVHIVEAGDIVDHYCLMFNRGVVHIVVAVILLTITV